MKKEASEKEAARAKIDAQWADATRIHREITGILNREGAKGTDILQLLFALLLSQHALGDSSPADQRPMEYALLLSVVDTILSQLIGATLDGNLTE